MPAEAAPAWLLVPGLGSPGDRVEFAADDRHYLARVCRARAGERVTATDGAGTVAGLRLESGESGLHGVIETLERRRREREAWLLCGPPEEGRADWLVEKIAELGVAVFQPVECVRGTWERAGRRRERWLRLAAAALRQSRNAFRLDVREPLGLAAALEALPERGSRWLADPAGPRSPAVGGAADPVIGAVGPAGGFDEAEWSSFTARGFSPISLSANRLRTETAALAWASWWSAG